ncbi:DUF1983 domain-containing protein [Escherichia coli]|uniref:DUF1983 domain-containing protein n=2 Tax=Escherichia coli TaxID=562 RepID=A0A6D0YAG0_ECOLX|nr:DUF1983 domain-containing protein [Escherichia coli]EGN7763834.1 DUF1983 domain-containing protein [Escherichia coli]EGT7782062.1 DUF1983 domain-containing protein [Escherichia coli]KAE9742260.1 DUF1983 domain-containing protein [Escherichia coli]NEL03073.1 DUF1983 domain-containing protein [Escherichia coli]
MTRKPWRAGKDLSAVVENMEIGTGQRGDGRHAFVTREELVGLKLARRRTSGGASYALNPGIEIDSTLMTVDFPTKPLNFKATGGFGSVLLEWDMPNYRGHSLTEIWRGTEDDLADAVLVATTPGQVYGDPVDPGWSGFYWIRFVNAAGVKGPWNAEKGTQAQTQIGVKAIIDQIRDEAAKSPVVSELRKEIKNAQGQAVKDAAIKTTEVVGTLREETTRTIGGIETRITTLDSSTSESLNEVDKRITKLDKEGGEAFLAMWSKKAGVDGITAGIGIVAGKDSEGRPVSQVAISASQLFVFDPNNPDNTAYPFAVSGGKVVIPKAMIYDAVIETLVSRKVVADEVKAGVSITSPVIRSAVIQNGRFTVGSDGSMKIGGRFSVSIHGDVTASNVKIRGHIDADSGTLNNVVIAENCTINGTLKAEKIIGDLVKCAGGAFPVDGDYLANGTRTLTVYDDHNFDRQIIIPPIIYVGSKQESRTSNDIWTECFLHVDQNGRRIYSGRSVAEPGIFCGIIDMPAGGGHITLSFTVISRRQNGSWGSSRISNLQAIVVKKNSAGISIL